MTSNGKSRSRPNVTRVPRTHGNSKRKQIDDIIDDDLIHEFGVAEAIRREDEQKAKEIRALKQKVEDITKQTTSLTNENKILKQKGGQGYAEIVRRLEAEILAREETLEKMKMALARHNIEWSSLDSSTISSDSLNERDIELAHILQESKQKREEVQQKQRKRVVRKVVRKKAETAPKAVKKSAKAESKEEEKPKVILVKREQRKEAPPQENPQEAEVKKTKPRESKPRKEVPRKQPRREAQPVKSTEKLIEKTKSTSNESQSTEKLIEIPKSTSNESQSSEQQSEKVVEKQRNISPVESHSEKEEMTSSEIVPLDLKHTESGGSTENNPPSVKIEAPVKRNVFFVSPNLAPVPRSTRRSSSLEGRGDKPSGGRKRDSMALVNISRKTSRQEKLESRMARRDLQRCASEAIYKFNDLVPESEAEVLSVELNIPGIERIEQQQEDHSFYSESGIPHQPMARPRHRKQESVKVVKKAKVEESQKKTKKVVKKARQDSPKRTKRKASPRRTKM